MAKAKEITELDCAASAIDWAQEVLRVRCSEVFELREAALNFSNIEGVHDMRVAIRRLRGALRVFMPLMSKRPLKHLRGKLKEIADALGAVRDEDVAILALEKLQTHAETDQSEEIKRGIKLLLDERNAHREQSRSHLIETLDIGNLSGLPENFNQAVAQAVKRKREANDKGKRHLGREMSFNQAGRTAVAESFEEFYDLGASLYEPFNVEALHEFRIAAKRLRYALELFTSCWGDKILEFADEVAAMQSALGEVHDCDVWIESLGDRLRKDQHPVTNQAAIWLLSNFARRRSKNYRAALERWGEWQTNDFAQRIKNTIDA